MSLYSIALFVHIVGALSLFALLAIEGVSLRAGIPAGVVQRILGPISALLIVVPGFYMVITTFSTIGYQEVHPLSHAGRVFNVVLIIAGVSLVFLGIGSLTQALLEFSLRSFFGRRKMERDIERLSSN